MNVISPTKPKAKISADEMTRRLHNVRVGDAENRLEAQFRGAQTDPIFDAYTRGEIDVTEIATSPQAALFLN